MSKWKLVYKSDGEMPVFIELWRHVRQGTSYWCVRMFFGGKGAGKGKFIVTTGRALYKEFHDLKDFNDFLVKQRLPPITEGESDG